MNVLRRCGVREPTDGVANLPDPRWASWNLGIFVCIR